MHKQAALAAFRRPAAAQEKVIKWVGARTGPKAGEEEVFWTAPAGSPVRGGLGNYY